MINFLLQAVRWELCAYIWNWLLHNDMSYFRCFAKESMEDIIQELKQEGTEWAVSKINVSGMAQS